VFTIDLRLFGYRITCTMPDSDHNYYSWKCERPTKEFIISEKEEDKKKYELRNMEYDEELKERERALSTLQEQCKLFSEKRYKHISDVSYRIDHVITTPLSLKGCGVPVYFSLCYLPFICYKIWFASVGNIVGALDLAAWLSFGLIGFLLSEMIREITLLWVGNKTVDHFTMGYSSLNGLVASFELGQTEEEKETPIVIEESSQ
jgi:hypothetical protein